jgi:two-component system, NarL family, sensor histidine kinase UhpB
MSLRFRLIFVVTAALAISLTLGGAVTLINAPRSVRNEMSSALLVGRQTVDNVVRQIDASPDPQRDLDDLITSFKGSRHLRVSLVGGSAPEAVQPADDKSPFGKVPGWFVRLIHVSRESYRAPIVVGGKALGTVVVETDPRNEILEVWNELSGSLIILALFGGTTIPLILVFIGRALRPLGRLTVAMEQVGQGDYGIRVDDRLTPELARLRDSFNRMAARLAATDADNRRLNEQLLTLQEEERSELARDLHDEVGPFLFGINVDVSNMSRLLREGRVDELPAHTQSIAEAVRHLQRQVRGMLGRLWPVGLAELGLGEAVRSLVGFWRRRFPDIAYQVTIAPECEHLENPADTTIYRIVQECLSNAVRHGKPGAIAITIDRNAKGDVVVEIADDGSGLGAAPGSGYGLIGMEERVRTLGGRLDYRNLAGGGFAVTAALPLPPASELAASLPPERAR